MKETIGRHDEVFQFLSSERYAPFYEWSPVEDDEKIGSLVIFHATARQLDMKEAVDYRFTRLIKELQDVLPADRWGGGETQGRINSILS